MEGQAPWWPEEAAHQVRVQEAPEALALPCPIHSCRSASGAHQRNQNEGVDAFMQIQSSF